jgi:hypothetical protein
MINIITVLRSGGEFGPAHVAAVRDQIARHSAPGACAFLCLTDQPREVELLGVGAIPLVHDWPGWWSKMELFRLFAPGSPAGCWLFLDLDTIAVRDLAPIVAVAQRGRFTALSDFFRPQDPAMGLLAWRGHELQPLYNRMRADPARWIATFADGDQGFIKDSIRRGVVPPPDRWQEEAPGAVVSYKADLGGDMDGTRPVAIPPDARLVCFHGRPRPWNSTLADIYWRGGVATEAA